MRFTNKFPYTNINNINLDWIIKRVKELGETVRSYANDIANAVALAEAAQDAADSVTGTAESAVATAQAAEATANAIAGTANSALSTAQAANTTAQAAEATANAIAGTANSALSTAQAANATAQAANTTAQAAEESADNAETIAGTASANASNAVQTANTALSTAQTALTIASQFNMSVLNEKAGALITTESGELVSFVPDRTIEQNLSVIVAVKPQQDLHGQESPWPAGGGKNIINPADYPAQSTTTQGVTFSTNTDGSISISGTATGTASFLIYAANSFPVTAGNYAMRLTFAGSTTGNINFVLSGGTGGSGVPYTSCSATSSISTQGKTFAATAAGNLAYVQLQVTSGATVSGTAYVQIQTGNTADAWSPYENICPISGLDSVSIWNELAHDTTLPPTTTVQLGQTVYGCKLTIAEDGSVAALVDSAIVDLGTLNWVASSEALNHRFSANMPANYKIPTSAADRADFVCSSYAANPSVVSNTDALGVCGFQNANSVFIRDLRYSDDISFRAAVTGVKLVYKIASPFEIQLAPVQIAAIAGRVNNVWSDAGNVTVEFAADLKWYIDSQIVEVQALALENGG